MRKLAYILLIAFLTFSCKKDATISEDLIGDWLYERETFDNSTSFEDLDTEGYMSFRRDKSGNWNQSNVFFSFILEWELQSEDTQLSISRELITTPPPSAFTRVFDITRVDENNYILTYHLKIPDPSETIEGLEQFENIILTRME